MTAIAEKALATLQAINEKDRYSNSDLISNGFSEGEAKLAISELEEHGHIAIITTYINGNVSFKLT